MNEEAERLLMMFINDSYKKGITKKTSIEMMKYVSKDPALQAAVNNGDSKKILNHKPH